MMAGFTTFDVAVIGAGVFGSWTAYELTRAGASVVLLDAYGPGNSRASSGGESRVIRMGYGSDEIYTRMAQRSLERWQQLFNQREEDLAVLPLFQRTGVLWLAKVQDPYSTATLQTLQRCKVTFERLKAEEVSQRYPSIKFEPGSWSILEPDSGVLMARGAVRAVFGQAVAKGLTYLNEASVPFSQDSPPRNKQLDSLKTISGERIFAKQYVFACGPWLPKLFPALLGDLIYVTRQEVFFLGVPAGDGRFGPGVLPVWIDFNDLVYGIPNLDNRGFKIAIDKHGPAFDPDTGERIVRPESIGSVRAYLARRMPSLENAPVLETRVCQYENTSSGDFLIDRHPEFENVWLAGGGSGHGFKHGPAVGEHVAALLSGNEEVERRFSLATKERVQQRKVY